MICVKTAAPEDSLGMDEPHGGFDKTALRDD